LANRASCPQHLKVSFGQGGLFHSAHNSAIFPPR
jgi:hypothetical protein